MYIYCNMVLEEGSKCKGNKLYFKRQLQLQKNKCHASMAITKDLKN